MIGTILWDGIYPTFHPTFHPTFADSKVIEF